MSDQRGRSRWRWWVLVAIVLMAASFLRKPWLDYQRPMFHNLYGKNDRMLLSRWVYTPPLIDRAGNLGQYDERLNLLVIVFTHEPDGYNRFGLWSTSRHEATLTVDGPAGREALATIPRSENRVLIFDMSAKTRFETALSPGEAMKLRDRMSPRSEPTVDDFAVVLKPELARWQYPAKAEPMATGLPRPFGAGQ